jgi:hypothetical protein
VKQIFTGACQNETASNSAENVQKFEGQKVRIGRKKARDAQKCAKKEFCAKDGRKKRRLRKREASLRK